MILKTSNLFICKNSEGGQRILDKVTKRKILTI